MSAEIFEMLHSSLLNLDDRRYISILSNIPCNVVDLLTQESNNSKTYLVLHELSLNIGKEDHLLTFMRKIMTHVTIIQHSKSPDTLKSLVNHQNKDGKTPLHLSIMTGRKVKIK